MSELAYPSRQFGGGISYRPKTQEPLLPAPEVASVREKLDALRDVMVTLGLQIIFRAALLLQRWNY